MLLDIFLVSGSVDAQDGTARRAHQLAWLFSEQGHRVRLIGVAPAADGARRLRTGSDLPYRVSALYDAPPPAAPARARHRLDLPAHRRRRAHERGMRAKAAELSALFRGAGEAGGVGGTGGTGGVVVVTEGWALEWVALADTTGLPVVLMSHEPYAVTKRSGRFQRLRWLCRQHADRVLAPTRQDADWWIRSWVNHTGVMPGFLPDAVRDPSPRDRKCVLGIGRLDHDKGPDILLDAWAQVAPRHPDWRLRMYGESSRGARAREEALHKQCAELGLGASVEWMGFTQDVPGALREGSVFVLPSRQEGFPVTPLEAKAAGLPCVAFDVSPGVREIVTDGVDGLLARPGNVDELARHIERLMVDRELREQLGDAARESVRRYAPEVVGERWEKLFALLRR
ncbi:glycosyltransferase [Streptomyces sp. NPDC021093]|uniref:glycosyltransferase n=1 Tax=Streptomyces sp. NPDC021093 TaxID=3365112 RepID=UPI0037A5ED74